MENLLGEIVYNFASFFNGITRVIIPLSFTIFFFAYREIKDVAYSLFKVGTKAKVIYFLFLILTLLVLMINIYVNLDSCNYLSWRNTLPFFIDLLWLGTAIVAYIKILETINLEKMFNNLIEVVEKSFKKITTIKDDWSTGIVDDITTAKKIKKEVKRIRISVEVLFQIMLSKNKYNLKKDFSDSLDDMERILFKEISDANNEPEKFSFIVPYSGGEYSYLYSITLHGMVDLLNEVLETDNPKDISMLIRNFNNISLYIFNWDTDMNRLWKTITNSTDSIDTHFKNMYDEYYYSSYRIINQLYKKNNNSALLILKNLAKNEQQSEMYSSGNDLLTLIASLVINAIEDGNIKLLTDVVNVILDLFMEKKEKIENNHLGNAMIRSDISDLIERKVREGRAYSFYEMENKIYRFLFLSIVKSIELGRYNCAGFLIKVTVRNFNVKNFNNTILEIAKNISVTSPELDLSKKLSKILPLNYTFSTVSYKYCFLKTALLIYYQKKFTTDVQKINFTGNDEYLDLKSIFREEESYLQYLNEKIKGLNKEYGLIFLEKSTFDKIKVQEL